MNNEPSERLREKLNRLPRKPGVYQFKDECNRILYIGKAKVLRNRVRSYFHNSEPQYTKTAVLKKKIRDVDYIVTDTEKEALILEANLVKLYRPRYNVNLKDDKSFPYIKITSEDFPQVFPTRKKVSDGGTYFGPYTEVKVMRTLLWTLRKIFPIRSCKFKLNPDVIKKRKVKLCLDYHIKRCSGPCEEIVSREEYNDMISQIRDFLRGHTKNLVGILTTRMQEAAASQKFESAAMYRDRLREIENFKAKQKVVDIKPVDRDIVAVAAEEDTACGVVFMEREGKIMGRRNHALESIGGRPREEILRHFIMQVYLNAEYVPPEIIASHDVGDRPAIQEWLSEMRNGTVKIVTPQKGSKAKLAGMCVKNADLLLREMILQREQKKDYIAYSVQALKKDLMMDNLPMSIEAFDISNIQGRDAVASLVSFYNGAARKKDYRIFRIKSQETPDDFAMIAEAVKRRYTRLKKEGCQMPDLILVDGGKGQLSSAHAVLHRLGLGYIPVIGLAKRLDEVFIPGYSHAQNIAQTSAGLRLLQRVRDEAHRFALQHHRRQRKKRTLASELDTVPGVGPERKKSLLKYFGSLSRLRSATPETISRVNNIGKALAQTIYDRIHTE